MTLIFSTEILLFLVSEQQSKLYCVIKIEKNIFKSLGLQTAFADFNFLLGEDTNEKVRYKTILVTVGDCVCKNVHLASVAKVCLSPSVPFYKGQLQPLRVIQEVTSEETQVAGHAR